MYLANPSAGHVTVKKEYMYQTHPRDDTHPSIYIRHVNEKNPLLIKRVTNSNQYTSIQQSKTLKDKGGQVTVKKEYMYQTHPGDDTHPSIYICHVNEKYPLLIQRVTNSNQDTN